MKVQPLIRVFKNYFPICFINQNEVLFSKLNKLFVYNLKSHDITFLTSLNKSYKQVFLGRVNILNRLFRLGVRYGILNDERKVLLVYDKCIFELDLENCLIFKSFRVPRGNTPLNIAEIKDINGFDNTVCFGEYFGNPSKNEVNIYKRSEMGGWDIIYTFSDGKINHIHSIIPDEYNGCVWILTGDFGDAAAIWMATDNFQNVQPVAIGKQIYRSCVAFSTPTGLLYATDSQFEVNTIRLLQKSENKWTSISLGEVNGPVIYGSKVKDSYVFSTSVEGMSTNKHGIFKYLDKEIGKGVKEDYAHIVIGNIKSGFNTIYKNQKDFLPFILFQFGVIGFPSGFNNSNFLIFHNTALENYDLSTCVIELT